MSSTTGVQNFLVNVFRPVYTYDSTTTLFTPKLMLSNIDTYSGNIVSVLRADVGDANSNCYVGSNAGNPYTTLQGCSNVAAFGVGAGSNISNVSNSVFVGFYAGANAVGANSNVVLGNNASGNGNSNVRIGSSNTGTGNGNVSIGTAAGTGTGSSNIILGTATSASTYSKCILLAPGITATQDNQFRVGSNLLYGDLSSNWLGVGRTTPIDSNSKFDVSGNAYFFGQVGINMVPIRTLDVNGNFRSADAFGSLDFNNGSFTVTAAFKRTLGASNITQPIIQYGKESGSGGSGSVTVTLPVAYSDTTYVAHATMQNTDPAEIAVDITSSNQFTIHWANGGGGSHQLGWTTYGT